jgi:ATP-binding protein involved in chromosome partitioning
MSIGFLVPKAQPLIWRGPMLHSAIRQFIHDVEWGELEYLIIDLPPGTGDAQLSLSQSMALTGGAIVTLPQKVSQEDARRGLEMFRTMQVPVLGVIENMTSDVFGRGGGEELAREAGVPFLGAIPLDPVVRQASDGGVPVVISHPDSAAAKAFDEIARELAARGQEQRRGPQVTIEMMD